MIDNDQRGISGLTCRRKWALCRGPFFCFWTWLSM